MADLYNFITSSVGKKFVSGFTGLSLILFLCVHLLGNLLLFAGPDAFNSYAHFLEHLGHGMLIYVAEAGLILFFGLHIVSGTSVYLKKRRARTQAYFKQGNAGGASRKTLASRSMIVTGLVVLVFVILHVKMFKYGPAELVIVDGVEMKDLYGLVLYAFKEWWISLAYTAVMILLGLHLRHGVWSAFQSLGAANPRYMPLLQAGGLILAVLLAVGFALLPTCIFFFFETPAPTGGI